MEVLEFEKEEEEKEMNEKWETNFSVINSLMKKDIFSDVCHLGRRIIKLTKDLTVYKDQYSKQSQKIVGLQESLKTFEDQNLKLDNRNQELEDSRLCKICMVEEVSQLLNPCNHVVCCNNCEIIRLKKRLTVYEDQNSKQRHQIVGLQESLESFGDQNLRLDHKNQELQDSRLCKICMDQEVSQLLIPCNHVVCCNNCIIKIQECPICRKNIEDSKMIYFS